jgi:thioredoxin 2
MAAAILDDRGIVTTCPSCGQKNRLAYERLGAQVRCGRCKAALAPPSAPIDLHSSEDFDRLISRSALPVVVDFWATWCGPCRMVAPELEKVAARQAGRVLVVKVDTDELSDVAGRFGVRSIPTLGLFVGGREVAKAAGARPAKDIEAFIEQAAETQQR